MYTCRQHKSLLSKIHTTIPYGFEEEPMCDADDSFWDGRDEKSRLIFLEDLIKYIKNEKSKYSKFT